MPSFPTSIYAWLPQTIQGLFLPYGKMTLNSRMLRLQNREA